MFQQVRICKSEQCAQTYWSRGFEFNRPHEIYEMLVMVSAEYVKNLNDIKQSPSKKNSNAISTKFYVDDYLDFVDVEQEVVHKILKNCKCNKLG